MRRLTESWVDDLPVKIAAPAAADPVAVIGRPQARKMDRYQQFALVAAREAWADAGSPEVDPYRLGVAVTSGIGGIGSTLAAYDTLNEKGWTRISPFTVPMLMPNGAGRLAQHRVRREGRGARGGQRLRVRRRGDRLRHRHDPVRPRRRGDRRRRRGRDHGAERSARFAVMRAMSTRNDEPERASRPFDKGRDGFVLGEGAGVVILESLEHALARDARIYAVAAGAGYSSDAHHISLGAPDGEGVKFAINAALRDAGGRRRPQVVHVNAHATSTPGGDPPEAMAIQAALGADADGVVVSGHQVDDRAPARRGRRGRVGRRDPGAARPDGPADDQPGRPRRRPGHRRRHQAAAAHPPGGGRPMAVLNDAFGFGGHNVALAFTEYQPKQA